MLLVDLAYKISYINPRVYICECFCMYINTRGMFMCRYVCVYVCVGYVCVCLIVCVCSFGRKNKVIYII